VVNPVNILTSFRDAFLEPKPKFLLPQQSKNLALPLIRPASREL